MLTVSPWSSAGASASAVDAAAIIWLIVLHIVASGVGGYLAGRLRTKWTAIHTDEVYFRDTAHGFLAWAVAVVITAAFLGWPRWLWSEAPRKARKCPVRRPRILWTRYSGQLLYRPRPDPLQMWNGVLRGAATRTLANALRQRDTATADRAYLTQFVTARTGLSENDAAQRVSTVMRRVIFRA